MALCKSVQGVAAAWQTLGNSREPPAAIPIELPTCKAAPLQALGVRLRGVHHQDENETPLTPQSQEASS